MLLLLLEESAMASVRGLGLGWLPRFDDGGKAVEEALGGVGIRITDPQEISTALTRARQINFDEGKSVLLDVRTQQELKFSTYPD